MNEKVCKDDTTGRYDKVQCFLHEGRCKQNWVYVDLLKRQGCQTVMHKGKPVRVEKWVLTTEVLRTSCECEMRPDSHLVHQYIAPKKQVVVSNGR